MAKRIKKPTSPDGFPQKKWDKLPTSWRDAANGKSTDEINKEIVTSAKAMHELTKDMEADQALQDAKEEFMNLKGAYTDTLNTEKAKIDFCVYLLTTRGVA